MEINANEADREVHDLMCGLTTGKISETPCTKKTIRTSPVCANFEEMTARGENELCCVFLRLEIKASRS